MMAEMTNESVELLEDKQIEIVCTLNENVLR